MTLPATARRAGPLLGNGVATDFPFDFKVFAAGDLHVVKAVDGVETDLVLNTDYLVTLNVDQDADPGGVVKYAVAGVVTPLPVGVTLTIVAGIPYDQTLNLPAGGNFSPRALENGLDRQVMQIQQLAEMAERTVRLPVSMPEDVSTQLPLPSALAVLRWNEDADGLENYDPATVAGMAFRQSGAGASLRDAQTKMREALSVTDFDTVAEAVAEALARAAWLYWPEGAYVTTASIPNFHSVRHFGPGRVVRGADTFYISPTPAQVNRVYVNVSTGNNANDGLSAAQPRATIQGGIDAVANWREALLLGGVWRVTLAAGTYARARFPEEGLPSLNPIYIEGPAVGGHPNVPTAIVKQGATEAATGLVVSGGVSVYLKDIKFEDYNGTNAAAGVSGGSCKVYTENAHFTDCYYGISVGGAGGLINVKGGIFDDCGRLNSVTGGGHALRGFFHVKFEVGTQEAGTLANGPIIRNSSGAARVQELCTGHFDYVTVEDCDSGIRFLVNSRLNLDGSSFKRSGTALYLTNGSLADVSSTTVFGTGVDANARNYVIGQGSMSGSAVIDGETLGNATEDHCIKTRFPGTVVSSVSSANTIDSLTIKAGALAGIEFTGNPTRRMRLVVKGTLTGTAGTYKRVALRLGAATIALLSFAGTSTGAFEAHLDVHFVSTSVQFLSAVGFVSGVVPTVANAAGAVDMSVDQTIAFQAYVQNAADSITISSYEWHAEGV